MRILRHPEHCLDSMKQSVMALGNFDGVHKGHQRVIATARKIAGELGAPSAVMTFEPHPAMVLKMGAKPMRITPFRSKMQHIAMLDVDIAYVQRFSQSFAQLSAEEFIENILVRGLEVRHVVVGEDFNFGRGRGGNAALLQRMAAEVGFGVTCVTAVEEAGERCSSTRIRQLLLEGKMEALALLLGRDYTVSGRVVKGDQRGRQLGFPTANIRVPKALLPAAFGVYAVQISWGDGEHWQEGVANFGVRPTISLGDRVSLEVHIFGFNEDIYGRQVQVRLLHHLRPEQKFPSLDALKAQIARDKEKAEAMLGAYHHA